MGSSVAPVADHIRRMVDRPDHIAPVADHIAPVADSQDETRVANDGALYTRAQFERYYKDRADSHWQWAAMRRQIGEAPLPATKVVRTAFDEDRIQCEIDEIVRALDEALGAEEIPRIYFPSTAFGTHNEIASTHRLSIIHP